MAYSGNFQPVHPHKYEGNPANIVFRSLWERALMDWLDKNPDVKSWQSEEFCIPYTLPEDGRTHRYYPDFKVTWASGKTFIIEVKPEHETKMPVVKKNKTQQRLMEEISTYSKNAAKWEAAAKWSKDRGYVFVVWTEHSLAQIGIKTAFVAGKFPKKRKVKP